MNAITAIAPILTDAADPECHDAEWVGEIRAADTFAASVALAESGGYRRARLLVRDGSSVLGFISVGVEDGCAIGREIAREASRLPARTDEPAAAPYRGPVSVVVCTRDRPRDLRRALESIQQLDYPDFEVVVVDNASSSLDTWRIVAALDDSRFHVVNGAVPGLASARNRGVEAARHEVLAFTDDDVSVDTDWLAMLVRSFADPEVGCTTGLVPPAQLRNPAQLSFQRRVGWTPQLSTATFRISDGPANGPLFPFNVARYGTGANFAARRSVLLDLGGFDEGLGAGAPTRGGEDIDWFVRCIVAGHTLVFDPDAVVWHVHRDDVDDLSAQAAAYGTGLGAWLTKVALDRELRPIAARRTAAAARHLITSLNDRAHADGTTGGPSRTATRDEFFGLLRGPGALWQARTQGRRAAPLCRTDGG
ncbi:MAG: glycosyltransferase [Gordonia sp. (in: high G+C Gram-positive bacteria)]